MQELARLAQHDPWRQDGRPCGAGGAQARQARAPGSRGRDHGLRHARGRDRRQHRAPDRDPRRHAGDGGRRLRRRRRRVDLAGAERGQQAPRQGRVAHAPQARNLLADAADRGIRIEEIRHPARSAGPLRRGEPAQGRARQGRRQVQGGNRAHHHQDEGGGQDDGHRNAEGSHRRARRRHPPRHDLRRRVADQAGHRGRRDRGGQREPVLRRRLGAGRHERQAGGQARPQAARRVPRLCGGRLRAERDGHRPGLRHSQAARAHRAQDRRHRPVGAQ